MPSDMSPQMEKLLQLKQLQDVQQQPDETPGLVKMLGELYGIHEQQEKGPAELALLKAHGDYYGQLGEDRPEERQARSLELRLAGLDKAYAYDRRNPEYHAARHQVLKEAGYNVDGPIGTAPQPHGAYGSGGASPPTPPSTSKFAALGPALSEDYKGAHNAVGVPAYNWLANLVGGEPAQPYTMPKDYDFWGLHRRQPAPTGATQ